ncbi:MAG TPA: LD-carboxypeptidase [Polyangiaceae bacterium]
MQRLPPALAPGDVVAVVAPSSPFPREQLLQGMAWLRLRYALRVLPGLFAREAYLAGADARRSDELGRALTDPSVKAVFAARGGYGAMRILDAVRWDDLARHPKWLVGFSDVTALHAMTWRAGLASVHGPNVTGLGSNVTPRVRASLIACLEDPGTGRAWRGLRVVHGGSARGVVVGGNLSLLHGMAAAGLLAFPAGAILAIEDVTEAPYRVDRMLTSLRIGGHLAAVSGVVLGEFERCPAGADGRSVEEVLAERTADLGVPVLGGAPFGHGVRNEAFVLGSTARIEGDAVIFEEAR